MATQSKVITQSHVTECPFSPGTYHSLTFSPSSICRGHWCFAQSPFTRGWACTPFLWMAQLTPVTVSADSSLTEEPLQLGWPRTDRDRAAKLHPLALKYNWKIRFACQSPQWSGQGGLWPELTLAQLLPHLQPGSLTFYRFLLSKSRAPKWQ